MAATFIFSNQQILDSNGDPIVGAKLESYAEGTSTPLATYSDEALTTANANPASGATTGNQVTGGDGRFGNIYLQALAYKFILKDDGGNTIWTIDNFNPDGGTVALAAVPDNIFTIVDNADATKAVAFQVSGVTTGTTRTLTVPDYDGTIAISHWYTPEMFGAAGDGDGEGGGTNDATALQAALNAINTTGGGTLYLLKRYRSDSQLTVYSNTRIIAVNGEAGIDGHNFSSSAAIFRADGSVSNAVALSGNAAEAATSVSVAAGAESPFAVTSGHAVGPLVRVYSDEVWYDANATAGGTGVGATPNPIYCGEFNYVKATSSGSITLLNPLRDAYTTANTATIQLVTPVTDITIEGGLYFGGDTPSTNNADNLIAVQYGERITIRNVTGRRIDNAMFNIIACVGVNIEGCRVYDQRSSTAYGVAVSNSQGVRISGLWAIRSRHATSVVSSSAVDHRGPSRDVIIEDFFVNASAPAYSGDSESSGGDAIDFHGSCQGAIVRDGVIIGSTGHGIIIECPDVEVSNVRIIGSQNSGIVATNRAHTSGYLRIRDVFIDGFSLTSGGWQGVDVNIGYSDLAGSYNEITFEGGGITRTTGGQDVEEAFRVRRLTGSNTTKVLRLYPALVEVDGSIAQAVNIDRVTDVFISGKWRTNDASASVTVPAWDIENASYVEISGSISATGSGGSGLELTSCTKAVLSANFDASSATGIGIDFNATGTVIVSPEAVLNVDSCGDDGLVIDGATVASLAGVLSGNSCTSDGIYLNNIGRLEFNMQATVNADLAGARVSSCNNASFTSGFLRKTSDTTQNMVLSSSSDVTFGPGFLLDHQASSGSFANGFTDCARLRVFSTVKSGGIGRLLDINNCDNAVLGPVLVATSGSPSGIDIDSGSDGVVILPSTTFSGIGTQVTDAGTNTVRIKAQPYATATAANIASAAASINTSAKYAGRRVYDTTNKRVMVASGSGTTDAWYTEDHATTVTPA